MRDLIEKLEACGFECEAGPLENSRAWQELKKTVDDHGYTELYPVEEGWIGTYSGGVFRFGPDEIDPDDIRLEDVAHVLSMLCRYNGHTKRFYSVAEHCCHMADHVLKNGGGARLALTALHHDDAEYIIGDMARPIKVTMPNFKALEDKIDKAVSEKFGTIWPLPAEIKKLDSRIINDEKGAVMNQTTVDWGTDRLNPLGAKFWNVAGRFPWIVRKRWLRRHHLLQAAIREGAWYVF